MATTAFRQLPYPASADAPDGAGAFQALAQKLEDQDPRKTTLTGATWPALEQIWDPALSVWRNWESRWLTHGAPTNYTNGANGSALAMSKWSGGDLLIRGKIVFGSSSPALPGIVQFAMPSLPSGHTIDENGYQPVGVALYQRAGVAQVLAICSFNAGVVFAAPAATYASPNGGTQMRDAAGWPYTTPAQSDTLFAEIRLQVKWA